MKKCSPVISFVVLVLVGSVDLSIVLEGNGYKNILVAISDDIPATPNEALVKIQNLKDMLTEASAVLFEATDHKVHFKEINILVPPSWNYQGATTTTSLSFLEADIRVTMDSVTATSGDLPYTWHSGKCGVAGNYITIPSGYLDFTNEEVGVQAKGFVQQWAQSRYGVFEEHGFPNDTLLPYFYRHPAGYDAVVSSNDTIIEGDLMSLTGGECDIDVDGHISNKDSCQFVPADTAQTATTSLMSFYWLDSISRFSAAGSDRLQPHRQNRMCGSKSSSDVIFATPDFDNILPDNGASTLPSFQFFKNLMQPVIYLAIDTSQPTSPSNAGEQGVNILKGGLRSLFFALEDNYLQDVRVAWSTFEGVDSGIGTYLKEAIPPRPYSEISDELSGAIDQLAFSTGVVSRDVSAVIRDAEQRLRQYKNVGGSILYIISATESGTNDTVTETDMAESFLRNNIKLEAAESGPNGVNKKALNRLSVLAQGEYYYSESWGSTFFFKPITDDIISLCGNGLTVERRMITSKVSTISTNTQWEGQFSIDQTIGKNTAIALRTPTEGSFTVTFTDPSGQQMTLQNEPEITNWNDVDSEVGISWMRISDPAASGRWSYAVRYDTTSCANCEPDPEIHLQISSSISGASSSLPEFQSWVSLTTGSGFVDMSKHPAIIHARFVSGEGPLSGLKVTADIVQDSFTVETIPLFDTGTMDGDISRDGIYSAIWYPDMDDTYTVNIHAVEQETSTKRNNRMLSANQSTFCCGSSIPTVLLKHFEMIANEAVTFEVRNTGMASQGSPVTVSDFQVISTYGVDGGKVYAELSWTVPINTKSQKVKYSEDFNALLDNFQSAPQVEIADGSYEDKLTPGTPISVYVKAPYSKGKNVYLIVEITGTDERKTRSHLAWTDANPDEIPFTTGGPSTSTISSSSTTSPSSTTQITSTTESTSVSTTTETTATTPTSPTTETTPQTTETTTDSTSLSTSSTTSSTTSATTETTEDTTSSSTTSSTTSATTVTTEDTTSSSTTTESTSSSSTSTTETTTETTETTSSSTSSTTSSTTSATTATTPDTTVETTTDVATETTKTTETTTQSTSTTTDSTTSSSTPSDATSTTNPATETTTEGVASTSQESTATTSTDITTTTDSVETTTQDPGPPDDPLPIGYIVGGVVLGLVVIGGAAGGVVFYKKRAATSSGALVDDNVTGGSALPEGRSIRTNSPYAEPPRVTAPKGGYSSYQQEYRSPPSSSRPETNVQSYDNLGITIEDDDTLMTAM